MTEVVNHIARGRTDANDRILEVDGSLAELNRNCGGEVGVAVAIPELLAIVTKAREYGLRLSRQFQAIADNRKISAWVEVTPVSVKSGGCEISVASWHTEIFTPEPASLESRRRSEINRELADMTVHLDPARLIASVENNAPDLIDFAQLLRSNVGSRLDEFVDLPNLDHGGEIDQRLVDGTACTVLGSDRVWTLSAEPVGNGEPGTDCSVVYFHADGAKASSQSNDKAGSTLGQDLTPILRQPLNRIVANSETIRTQLAGPLDAGYSDYAADIAGAGQYLLALMEDLSDLEVVEADDFSTAPDRIDLADVARRACGILRVRASERRITLVPPMEGECQMAVAEFRRVLQVLLNLIGNAIRYAPGDSSVWVRLDAAGDRATVTVADQGHGLSMQEQKRIFDKFERLGRGDDGGSGLGLFISKRIARAMGGDLMVDSAPGQGARFTLSVPVDKGRS